MLALEDANAQTLGDVVVKAIYEKYLNQLKQKLYQWCYGSVRGPVNRTESRGLAVRSEPRSGPVPADCIFAAYHKNLINEVVFYTLIGSSVSLLQGRAPRQRPQPRHGVSDGPVHSPGVLSFGEHILQMAR